MADADKISRGMIDMVTRRSSDCLRVGGWAASSARESYVDARVEIDGLIHSIATSLWGVESPDVSAILDGFQGSGKCRFYIDVCINPADEFDNSCLAVTPITSRSGLGPTLLCAIEPRSVMPGESVVEAVGGGEFGGLEFLNYFVNLAGLRRDASVLDIGCGVGRMAFPLSFYLASRGSYLGFDIVEESVAWAREHFAHAFPRFRFVHVDVFNAMYNPMGTLAPDRFQFPTEDRTIDFAILTSVFTHMGWSEVQRYIQEMARVIRPGGRALATCFLLDGDVRERMTAGRCTRSFTYDYAGGATDNPVSPESAIAFEHRKLRGLFECHGFELQHLYPGSWSGYSPALSYQDVLVLGLRK